MAETARTTRDLLGTGKTPQKKKEFFLEFLALAKVFRTHTFSTMTSDAVRHLRGTVEGNQKLALATLRMIVTDILEPYLELEKSPSSPPSPDNQIKSRASIGSVRQVFFF